MHPALSPTSDREITATRLLHAPREVVWQALLHAFRQARWRMALDLAPSPQPFAFTVGGVCSGLSQEPAGPSRPWKIIFLEIEACASLVFVQVLPPLFEARAKFIHEAGGTKIEVRVLFETAGICTRLTRRVEKTSNLIFECFEACLQTADQAAGCHEGDLGSPSRTESMFLSTPPS